MLANSSDTDLKISQVDKYSGESEEEARRWVEEVIGHELEGETLHEQLKVRISKYY